MDYCISKDAPKVFADSYKKYTANFTEENLWKKAVIKKFIRYLHEGWGLEDYIDITEAEILRGFRNYLLEEGYKHFPRDFVEKYIEENGLDARFFDFDDNDEEEDEDPFVFDDDDDD